MTQLILDLEGENIALPESREGGYTAEKRPLSDDVTMITGRLVRELRGNVWVLKYQYGYFTDAVKNRVLAACEKGRGAPIVCAFLPPDSAGDMTSSRFFVTAFTYPKFMWSRDGGGGTPAPMWADFSVELREVRPGD